MHVVHTETKLLLNVCGNPTYPVAEVYEFVQFPRQVVTVHVK